MDLSIVVPAHNERARLPRTIQTIRTAFEQEHRAWELLIVDNASSDDTLEIAAALVAEDRRIRLIECPKKGKGSAVRLGMLESRGDVAIFVDADGSSPIEDIGRIYCTLLEGNSVAIGTRNVQADHRFSVERPFTRRIASLTLNFLLRLLYRDNITDYMCGLKGFRREVIPLLFRNLRIEGWAFDIEVIYLARKFALPISEIPVGWKDQPNSSVRLIKDGSMILFDALRIPLLHRRE